MVEKVEDLRASRFGITKSWLIGWTIVSIITTVACYVFRPYVGYEDEFAVLVNATNVIAYVLSIGIPVFLASGIGFGTSSARKHILALQKSGKSSIEVFLRCLGETYALVLVFSVFVSLALFLEPQVVGITFYVPLGTGYLIYLLPVLTATLVVSLLLATIGVFLVIVTDNLIISTSIGCALTIGLATLVGWNPESFQYSLTKGIAMLSPSNIVRILAGVLSSYDPPHDATLATYFGFDATFTSILVTIASFGIIAFICTIASVKILHRTSFFWQDLQEMSSGIWETQQERRGEKVKIKRELKIRRVVLISSIILLLAIMPFWTVSYKSMVLEESTITFYQSPEGGEQITLGEWYVFSCNVQPTSYGGRIYLHHEWLIDNWGNAPDELSFFRSLRNMTSSEFQLLNETERRDLCRYRNRTKGEYGGLMGSWDIGDDLVFYIFAMKVIAAENASLSGFIQCSINLYQSPR